jgi:ADP-ribose pyrophosphatase YjhB (NUDIX family)
MGRREGTGPTAGRKGARARMAKRKKGSAARRASSISECVLPEGIRVGVGAVILDPEGRVLMVKHHPSDTPRKYFWKGRWICPGGMLEFGETLEDGARREVKEETGLDIAIIRVLEPAQRMVPWKGRDFMQVVYIDFLARLKGGALTPGDDVATCAWFGKRELEHLRVEGEIHEDALLLLERAGILRAAR